MPSPSITFGFILATLLGAGFHLVFGGDARRLGLFLFAGWIGFGIGQILGLLFEIDLFNVGSLRMFPALLGTLIALTVARLMSSSRTHRRSTRRG